MSDTPANLAAAMAALQTRLPDIKKRETANVKTDKASYSYTYADLAQITREVMPLLGALGLSFIAKPTVNAEGKFVLAYKLLHVSGEHEDGEYPLLGTGTPQAIGSAITYGRRYSLCAVTGIAPDDDDDGAAAMATYEPPRARTRARPTDVPAGVDPETGEIRDSALIDPAGAQMRRMQALFNEHNMGGAAKRLGRLQFATGAIGRDIGSANDLTKAEAAKVIDALTKLEAPADEPQP